jgi:hypothetical protein
MTMFLLKPDSGLKGMYHLLAGVRVAVPDGSMHAYLPRHAWDVTANVASLRGFAAILCRVRWLGQ